MAALLEAARDCMTDACQGTHYDDDSNVTDDPAFCSCRANLMTPLELVEWMQLEVKNDAGRPTSIRGDHREHMSASAQNRWARTRLEVVAG